MLIRHDMRTGPHFEFWSIRGRPCQEDHWMGCILQPGSRLLSLIVITYQFQVIGLCLLFDKSCHRSEYQISKMHSNDHGFDEKCGRQPYCEYGWSTARLVQFTHSSGTSICQLPAYYNNFEKFVRFDLWCLRIAIHSVLQISVRNIVEDYCFWEHAINAGGYYCRGLPKVQTTVLAFLQQGMPDMCKCQKEDRGPCWKGTTKEEGRGIGKASWLLWETLKLIYIGTQQATPSHRSLFTYSLPDILSMHWFPCSW